MSEHPGIIRVFLVDDHPLVMCAVENLIARADKNMVVAGSAGTSSEALEKIAATDPDIVVLDLRLGEDNGLDLIPQIQALSSARVLILTALEDQSVQDAAVLAGAKGVLEKTVAPELIIKAIEKVHQGQIWLNRAAISRVFMGRLYSPDQPQLNTHQCASSTLTSRERQIVRMTVSDTGSSLIAIAKQIHVSEHTLRNHLTSIYSKLAVSNRLELFALVQRIGVDRFAD